jgi:isocitrate dehydrogenase
LGESLSAVSIDGLKLVVLSNRGVKVWPDGHAETFCSDHWSCRFMSKTAGNTIAHAQIASLLNQVADAGFDFIKTENLYNFDGQAGYTLGQGE